MGWAGIGAENRAREDLYYRDGGGIKQAVRHASVREGGIPAIKTE